MYATDSHNIKARCSKTLVGPSRRMHAKDGDHTADMSKTLAVFQFAMFWLKADVEENICE
jgi:hypothetical protein